ncbi:cupin domain-containing protein [Ceratobasidium sp. AG-Ba]|nr:cupin domain-containing protein [Ceratobasidium sp. AG-Ba]
MESAPIEAPRQFISVLENKFSQLSVTVSPDDASLSPPGVNAEPLPAYTPSETPTPAIPAMPKAQQTEPQSRGRSPGPRSLASRGLLRHRNTSRNKPKSGQQPQTAALVVQLKRRLRQHQRQQGGTDSDDMEMDLDERRGRSSRRSSVRAGVLVARKRRETGDTAEDGDVSGIEVGTSRAGATPYERNNSALVCWSRRRASSFGERPRWTGLSETHSPPSAPTDQSTLPPPASSPVRRKRSGRSASTSGLPILDTTDLTVRRPSFAMSLILTPLIQDVDMASPMAVTPVMRTSTESSMWAPRKLQLGVTHGPIDDEGPSTSTSTAKTSATAPPVSPPPAYDSVIRPIVEDNDGDADDERTPLRTAPSAPLITVRDASPPAPGSGSGASKGSSSLATVAEEEEDAEGDSEAKPLDKSVHVVTLDQDQDAMIL